MISWNFSPAFDSRWCDARLLASQQSCGGLPHFHTFQHESYRRRLSHNQNDTVEEQSDVWDGGKVPENESLEGNQPLVALEGNFSSNEGQQNYLEHFERRTDQSVPFGRA